ncbi:unnamed protein product [Dibothriocephalus latus]|uniref:Reverse transcriptase domain-containing protein n=1 Tax=Dibothriocephalus latus TaxID=60516 RepID=A0A3P7RD21_DIBLA|nr:unnamed protein product [Dibothriocephalus latus]
MIKARPIPCALAAEVNEGFDRLDRADIIEPTQYSEWAVPIIPVLQADGSVGISGDYKLATNAETKLNYYSLPRSEDRYESLSDGQRFTTLDLKNAYNQVILIKESRDATTINTYWGLVQYKKLPFGNYCWNCSDVEQRALEHAKVAPTSSSPRIPHDP